MSSSPCLGHSPVRACAYRGVGDRPPAVSGLGRALVVATYWRTNTSRVTAAQAFLTLRRLDHPKVHMPACPSTRSLTFFKTS